MSRSTPHLPPPVPTSPNAVAVVGRTEPSLLERFAEASTWVRGKRVSVPEQGGYTGTTAGLDKQGFLLVNADDGTRRTVHSGGVREF